MNDESSWIVNDLRIDDFGHLVISAAPGYGNRKRWEGDMEFYLQSNHLDELIAQINAHKADQNMRQVAADEMREYIELMKADYLEKKRTLAEALNIDVQDVPKPYWFSFDDPKEPVHIQNFG